MPTNARPPIPVPAGLAPSAPRRGATKRAPVWALSVLVIGGIAYLGLFVMAVTTANTELVQALTVGPILVGLTVPIALRIARAEGDPTLTGIIIAGVVAKMLGALLRFYVAFEVYHGSTDAAQYHDAGSALAPDFRRFILTTDLPSIVGTGFVKVLTGVVYAIFGVSRIGGFLVFAWLGFLGLLLFARAFRIGVPEGDGRRYLILVLFLPSLVYWPSAMGKEAWMMLGIGLCAYGIACLLRRRTSGVVSLGAGLIAVLLVRPHVTLVIFVGLVVALLVRRAPARTYAAPLFRFLGLAALLVLGVFLMSQTASFLGQPRLTADIVTEQLSQTEDRTADGGSSFSPIAVNSPLDLPPAFVTVFFRPLPFETPSLQGLLTSGEGLLLAGLLFASRRRLRSIPRLLRSRPYVAFATGYVFAFVFAFSSFSNFGILARQRVQALPFLLVFAALPTLRDLTPTGAETSPATRAKPSRTGAPALPVAVHRRRSRRPSDAWDVPQSGLSLPPPGRTRPR